MEKYDYAEKIKGLDVFILWVDEYCVENNIPNLEYDATDALILKMGYNALLDLTSEECYANAICLMNYASSLQKEADKLKSHLSWCNAAMDYLFSQKWDAYSVSSGGSYTPKEIIKQSIIRNTPYAQDLEKCRIRLDSVYNIVVEQCKDVKTRVDLLQSLGKKRSFS
jgi:hypothetical protein